MDEETKDYLRDYYKLPEKVSDQCIVNNCTESLGYAIFRLKKAKLRFRESIKRKVFRSWINIKRRVSR